MGSGQWAYDSKRDFLKKSGNIELCTLEKSVPAQHRAPPGPASSPLLSACTQPTCVSIQCRGALDRLNSLNAALKEHTLTPPTGSLNTTAKLEGKPSGDRYLDLVMMVYRDGRLDFVPDIHGAQPYISSALPTLIRQS
eukprot:Gb_00654 [translate_table: standard]